MLLTLTLAVCPALPATVDPVGPAALSAPLVDQGGEEVSFTTDDKVEVTGAYYAPKQKKGKAPAALLLHDAGSSRGELEEVASYLQKKGFGVLALDLRGHGSSVSDDIDWANLDEDARSKVWSFASRDVNAAADYLLGRSEIHASNLSVIGVGHGCSLAVRHAIDDENTRAVVLVCPQVENYGFNLSRGIADLEGLPTLIVVPQERREVATRLQNAGNSANGDAFIDLTVVNVDPTELVTESRTRKETADWLSKQVMPRKR